MMSRKGTTGTLTGQGERYQEWLKVFGTDTIPLISPLSEWAELPEERIELVYKIDLKMLSQEQRTRLIEHLARKFNIEQDELARELDTIGCPILSSDIIVTSDLMWFL